MRGKMKRKSSFSIYSGLFDSLTYFKKYMYEFNVISLFLSFTLHDSILFDFFTSTSSSLQLVRLSFFL